MNATSLSLGRRLLLPTTAILLAAMVPASGAVAGAATDAVPLSPCVSSDNGSPVLQQVTLDHPTLDARRHARTLHVTVKAKDTGGPGAAVGVAGGDVVLETDEAQWVGRPLRRTAAGDWVASFHFPRHVGDQSWYLGVWLEDKVGNGAGYSYRNLHELGLPNAARVRSGAWRTLGFDSLRFGRGPIDTRAQAVRMPVRVRMTDSVPVRRVKLYAGDGHDHRATAVLHPVPGEPRVLRGHWLIPRFQTTNTWHVYSAAVISSIPYFEYYFGSAELHRAGAHRFRVVSGPDDSRAPTVQSYDRTPEDVDVTDSEQSIVSSLEAIDGRSGISGVTVTHYLRSDPYGFRSVADLHLVSGTPQDGTWSGSAALTPCHSTPGRWMTKVDAWDASGNHTRLGPAELAAESWPSETHVTGVDHILKPVFARTDDGVTVLVTFSEPVTGIDEASAVLFLAPYQTSDFDWSDPGPPVAGTWACQDGLGATTDCATGSVAAAVFTVTGTGSWDTLALNPDHVLSVRDLAGNPFDHTWIGVRDTTQRTRRPALPPDQETCALLVHRLTDAGDGPRRIDVERCLEISRR